MSQGSSINFGFVLGLMVDVWFAFINNISAMTISLYVEACIQLKMSSKIKCYISDSNDWVKPSLALITLKAYSNHTIHGCRPTTLEREPNHPARNSRCKSSKHTIDHRGANWNCKSEWCMEACWNHYSKTSCSPPTCSTNHQKHPTNNQ